VQDLSFVSCVLGLHLGLVSCGLGPSLTISYRSHYWIARSFPVLLVFRKISDKIQKTQHN